MKETHNIYFHLNTLLIMLFIKNVVGQHKKYCPEQVELKYKPVITK